MCDITRGIQTPMLKWIVESYSLGVFNQNAHFLDCLALKSEALRSFEESVNIYHSTLPNIVEGF
jgi:hypothetical protein